MMLIYIILFISIHCANAMQSSSALLEHSPRRYSTTQTLELGSPPRRNNFAIIKQWFDSLLNCCKKQEPEIQNAAPLRVDSTI